MIARTLALVALAVSSLMATLHAEARALPSREARVVVPLLLRAPARADLRSVEKILGFPDEAFVSGFYVYVFHLNDATSICVATRDRYRVFSICRSAPGQNAGTLYEPLGDDLMKPVPASAPF